MVLTVTLGGALPSHGRGHEFESRRVHSRIPAKCHKVPVPSIRARGFVQQPCSNVEVLHRVRLLRSLAQPCGATALGRGPKLSCPAGSVSQTLVQQHSETPANLILHFVQPYAHWRCAYQRRSLCRSYRILHVIGAGSLRSIYVPPISSSSGRSQT